MHSVLKLKGKCCDNGELTNNGWSVSKEGEIVAQGHADGSREINITTMESVWLLRIIDGLCGIIEKLCKSMKIVLQATEHDKGR